MCKENDNVKHPSHYQSKTGLEVIDVIRSFMEDMSALEGYYTGNILKYMCRWKKKNGLEDLKKAKQYLEWLIELEEEGRRKKHSGRYPWGVSEAREELYEKPDCFVPYNPEPSYTSVFRSCCCDSERKIDNDPSRPKDIVEIIWDGLCRVFFDALKEAEENDDAIKELNQSQIFQNSSLIERTILENKESKEDEK